VSPGFNAQLWQVKHQHSFIEPSNRFQPLRGSKQGRSCWQPAPLLTTKQTAQICSNESPGLLKGFIFFNAFLNKISNKYDNLS